MPALILCTYPVCPSLSNLSIFLKMAQRARPCDVHNYTVQECRAFSSLITKNIMVSIKKLPLNPCVPTLEENPGEGFIRLWILK